MKHLSLLLLALFAVLSVGSRPARASACGDKIKKSMKSFERTRIYRKDLGGVENLCAEAATQGNQNFPECVSQLAQDIGNSLVRPTGIIQICAERSDADEIEKSYKECREQQGKPPETDGLVAKRQRQEICLLEARRAERRETLDAAKPNRIDAAGTPPPEKNRPGHLNSDLKSKVITNTPSSSTGMEIIRNTGSTEEKSSEE